MSYANLGAEFSVEASTSGGVKTSGGGYQTVQTSAVTPVTMTCPPGYRGITRADGVWQCISEAQIKEFAAAVAKIYAIKNAAEAEAARARLMELQRRAQPVPAISATCPNGTQATRGADGGYRCESRAGILSSKALMIGGAIAAAAVLFLALRKKKAAS